MFRPIFLGHFQVTRNVQGAYKLPEDYNTTTRGWGDTGLHLQTRRGPTTLA